MLLLDEDGNCIHEQPGWHVLRDQHGMVLWDSDGQLCVEQDEDWLALQTQSVCKQAPESLVEQNHRLQAELSRAQFVHQSDVECVQEMMSQKDVQNQADFRAMAAELEQKKVESNAAIRVEWVKSTGQQMALDAKWAMWVNQMQAE